LARSTSFDAWMYHTQLGELVDLARAFPATPIVLDHVGVRSASAPMPASATRSSQNGAHESASSRPALHIKLGGLGMRMFGFTVHMGELPPSSEELAAAWRPYTETCIAALNGRDDSSNAMSDCFDLNQQPLPPPSENTAF
jgi:L-fuconolactonase